MKKLYPSFAPPETWRGNIQEEITEDEWKKLRLIIRNRDNYTCQYCNFKAEKWQICHHIDGNPNNNSHDNLEIICPMCNLIHHAGQGCAVQGVVDLYEESKFSQNEIIQITRKMRAESKTDEEIINFLGLENKVPFEMNREYLQNLFGFVTYRTANEWKTQKSLEYGYEVASKDLRNDKNTKFSNTLLNQYF